VSLRHRRIDRPACSRQRDGATTISTGSRSAGTSVTTPNLLAQFKVINGSSVPSPLNVFVDQNLLLSNIPFGGASSYQKTLAGSPSVSFETTATPGAALLTITPTLGPGTDTSILLTGAAGALKALVLGDNNLPPVPIRAQTAPPIPIAPQAENTKPKIVDGHHSPPPVPAKAPPAPSFGKQRLVPRRSWSARVPGSHRYVPCSKRSWRASPSCS